MKYFCTLFTTLIIAFSACFAQETTYYTQAVSLLHQGNTDSLKVHMQAWEQVEPNNAEIYALWLNYYYMTAGKEMVKFQEEEPLETSLAIVDSTGNTVGYMVSTVVYNEETLQKGYDKIDEGIVLYPNRLDFYFGKIGGCMRSSDGASRIRTGFCMYQKIMGKCLFRKKEVFSARKY